MKAYVKGLHGSPRYNVFFEGLSYLRNWDQIMIKKLEFSFTKCRLQFFITGNLIPIDFRAIKFPFNPLKIPNSDQHQIFPCNINAHSTPEVMIIKDKN